MKKIILLSLALVAGLFVLSNVTNAQSVDSATVTLKINTNTGNTRCDFGENLYLGAQTFSYDALTYTGTFITSGTTDTYWYCEDQFGYASWTVTAQTTAIINMDNAALQGATWNITDITLTTPQATLDAGSCLPTTVANATFTNNFNSSPQTIFGKDSAELESCKIGMDNFDIKVVTHLAQPVGNYSGTLNINVNQNFTIL